MRFEELQVGSRGANLKEEDRVGVSFNFGEIC